MVHAHGHDHDHREENIKVAVFLNLFLAVVEVVGGFWTNSLTLFSDALHDFGDSATLLFAWIIERKAKRPSDVKRTYGYQRLSLASSFLAGIVLIVGSLFIISKAIPRLVNPESVNATGMIIVAVIGLLLNWLAFLRLKKGHSVNERVLSWHMLEDFLGWVVILLGAIIIRFWDNPIIDPIMTIGFTSFILFGVFRNLREAFNIFLQGVPSHVNVNAIKKEVLSVKGVRNMCDVHVWSLEGETSILTASIIVKKKFLKDSDRIRQKVKEILEEHHIVHSTIEILGDNVCVGAECCFVKKR